MADTGTPTLLCIAVCSSNCVIQLLETVSIGIRQEHATGVPMEINPPPQPPPFPSQSSDIQWKLKIFRIPTLYI
jgi:hypothetical protein